MQTLPRDLFRSHPTAFEALGSMEFRALGVRAVDGDTLDVLVDVGFDTCHVVRLRVRGVNTPELGTKDKKVAEVAAKARKFTAASVEGRYLVVRTYRTKTGAEVRTFVRYVADVRYYSRGEWLDLAAELLHHKLAVEDLT